MENIKQIIIFAFRLSIHSIINYNILIFVVPSIVLYSSEISPTRCNIFLT